MNKFQRGFWLMMAVLFLATSIGFSALVIWQINQDNKMKQVQSSQADAQKKAAAAKTGCTIGAIDGGATLAIPEVFKPEGDVTELQSTDLEAGTGAIAKAGECLQMKYYGTLASSGEKFDGNYDNTKLLKFKLGDGQVIKGWDQGLVGLKEGGTRRLVIPSELAYGEQSQGPIPANADLVFVVKLVKIGE